jgi:hypothetical protein
MKRAKQNWWIDLVLFAGFILTFFLDLTGLPLHQWIGVGVGALIIVHLLVHENWLKGITNKFAKSSNKSRFFLVLDILLLVGFYLILYTGIIMSTWLNLNLTNYSAWYTLHLWSSIITLQVLLVKVAAHWKWIVNAVKPQKKAVETLPAVNVNTSVQPAHTGKTLDRRTFLRDSLAVGAVLFFEGTQIVNLVRASASSNATSTQTEVQQASAAQETVSQATQQSTQAATQSAAVEQPAGTATSVPTSVPTAVPTAVQAQSSGASTCTVICNRGCSYPGRCRRYVDNNGNGICDNTECA